MFFVLCFTVNSQQNELRGKLIDADSDPVPGVKVWNLISNNKVRSNVNGDFKIAANSKDTIQFTSPLFDTIIIVVESEMLTKSTELRLNYKTQEIEEVDIIEKRLADFDVGFLPPIKGVRLNNGTNSIINLEGLSGAKSRGNPSEMYAKIPGLNIWENAGAGIQVGIGGRGLSPKRTANFNTRQNGYDISADALGYPESYYTPPV